MSRQINRENDTEMLVENLPEMNLEGGTSLSTVRAVEASLGVTLPDDYVAFMLQHNGGAGIMSENNFLALLGIEEIERDTEDYGVFENAPGLLLFGSNGGNEAYAFDTRFTPWTIVRFPFISIHIEEARFVAPSFTEFLLELQRT